MAYVVQVSNTETPDIFKVFKSASDYVKSISDCADPLKWEYEFEKYFNIQVDYVVIDQKRFYNIRFESEQDYMFFLLRWS